MTESVTDVRCVLREERKEARARARKINSRRRKKRAKCVCVLETHGGEGYWNEQSKWKTDEGEVRCNEMK